MWTENHGGDCCGIKHICEFGEQEDYEEWEEDNVTVDYELWKNEFFDIMKGYEETPHFHSRRHDRPANWYKDKGILVEVVLTDCQIKDQRYLVKWLMKKNFRLVSRFTNKNSGNVCNVFHFHKHPLSIALADLPFKWKNGPTHKPKKKG